MKLLTLLLFLSLTLSANHIRWFSNYEDAHKKALKQNKHLMVLLVEKDCHTCQDSIKTTFMNKPYVDEINKEFIPVLVSKEQEQSYPIEMLYTLTYPTLFFLNKYELYSCEPIRGEITPKVVKNHIQQCK